MQEFRIVYRRRRRRRSRRLWAVSDEVALETIEASNDCVVCEISPCLRATRRLRARLGMALLASHFDAIEFMQEGGLRIEACVEHLVGRLPSGASKQLWADIYRRLRATGSFSGALEAHPGIFTETMLGICAAAELAGRLHQGVQLLALYARRVSEIRRQVVRGVVYPAALAVLSGGTLLVLCGFTLPRYQAMLSGIGVSRFNPLTRGCFFVGEWLRNPRFDGAVVGAAVLCVGLLAWSRRLRRAAEALVCGLPVARGAVEAFAMARLCVTFVCLSRAGFKPVDALELCEASAGPARYREAIRAIVAETRRNVPFGEAFERVGVLPKELILAVRSGEGSLVAVMERLGERYGVEAKGRIDLALRMTEPILLVLVVGVVFVTTLAVIIPMVQILDSVRS